MIPVLIGNKSDLKKEVNNSMIENVTVKYKLNYFEMSAKTGDGIAKFFQEFTNLIYELLPKEKKR